MKLDITITSGLKFYIKSKNKLQMNADVEDQDVFLVFKDDGKIDFILDGSNKSREYDSFEDVLKMLSGGYPEKIKVVNVSFPKSYEHPWWQFWKTISLDVWRSNLIDRVDNFNTSNPYYTTSSIEYLALGGLVKNDSKGHGELIKKITNAK